VRLERRVGGARAGSASFVYALTTVGQRVVDQDGPRRRLSEPSAWFVDHTLAIADFWIGLAVHARGGAWEILDWQSEPHSWREVVTLGGTLSLRPDLFVVLGIGDYEVRLFIEIDRGTEHMPAINRSAASTTPITRAAASSDRIRCSRVCFGSRPTSDERTTATQHRCRSATHGWPVPHHHH